MGLGHPPVSTIPSHPPFPLHPLHSARLSWLRPSHPTPPPTPLPSPHSIQTLTKIVIKLIDELGFKEKIIVVGHSIGTIIASNLAAEYPDRIGGVVLLGALNPCKGLAAILDGRIKAITELGKGLIDLASSLPRITTSRKSTPLERAYVLSSILSMDPNEYVRLSKAITNSKKPRYSVIKASLLILAGEDDMNVSSEEILEAYGTAKHKKKLEWLKDCGHWICVEKGDVVAISLLILFKNRAANTSSSLDPFTSSRRSLA